MARVEGGDRLVRACWLLLALGAGCVLRPTTQTPPRSFTLASSSSSTSQPVAKATATAKASSTPSAPATPAASAQPPADPMALGLTFDLPEPTLTGRAPLALWATYYYIPRATPLDGGHALRDMTGRLLGPRLSLRDWCEAAMQGTVFIVNGQQPPQVFNYAGVTRSREVDCAPIYPKHPAISRTRFTAAVGPYGDGVRSMILVPFRSFAVDRRRIPYGSVIYVPAARSAALTLPSGQRAQHDGYFYAADRGGAIKGNHVDVFIGAAARNPFAFVRSRSRPTFKAYLVDHAAARQRLSAAHRPTQPPASP